MCILTKRTLDELVWKLELRVHGYAFFRIVIYLIIVETNSFCIWQKSIYSLYGKCYRNQQMTEK